jgi:hypothetical protein
LPSLHGARGNSSISITINKTIDIFLKGRRKRRPFSFIAGEIIIDLIVTDIEEPERAGRPRSNNRLAGLILRLCRRRRNPIALDRLIVRMHVEILYSERFS